MAPGGKTRFRMDSGRIRRINGKDFRSDMRIVIQRVTHAAVRIGDRTAGEIGPGLLLLLGVGPEDTEEQADYLAAKTVNMRIFEDENGKMNRSVKDIGGEILVVSQFTLYARLQKGQPAQLHRRRRSGARKPPLRIFQRKNRRAGHSRGLRRIRRGDESQPGKRRPCDDSAGEIKRD